MNQFAADTIATPDSSREYLTFSLQTEEYAIDILKVQEIRGYDSVTSLPELPEMIKGVINLRGLIVPVIDLRIKFKLGAARYDTTTVMVVLTIRGRTVALVVDGVSDVVALPSAQIRPVPGFGAALDARYLDGIGTLGGRMLILLNVEALLGSDELAMAGSSLPKAA
jgi:purine-binding chemotaxis protein CheW